MKPTVLFLCTGNSCRSQMAEGFFRSLHGARMGVESAGTEPKAIDPLAVQVMAEAGIDISRQKPKSVEALDTDFDYVVTVCDSANESCPIFPAAVQRLHKGFEDPPKLAEPLSTTEERLAVYRRVRDEIREMVRQLPAELT